MEQLQAIFWNRDERRVRALWRLLAHTLAVVLIWLVGAELVASVLPALLSGESSMSWPMLAMLAASSVAAASVLVGRGLDRRRFEDFGLRLSPRWWADFGAGVMIGAVLMAGIFVVELGAGWLRIESTWAGAGEQAFALALLGPLVTFVGVGFYEELLFRGYHLRNYAEGLSFAWLGPRGALVIATVLSSILFGLVHAGNNAAGVSSTVYIMLAGGMLALGLVWTAELALPIGLHLSWNFFQGMFGFPVSGNDAGPRVFDIEQLGDPAITGGEFGPEAGMIGVVAMVIGAGLIAAWVRVTRGSLALRLELAQWRPDGGDARV